MKITVKCNKTEIVYEAQDPSDHPLHQYTGKMGNHTEYDVPFSRLLELIKTMSDNVYEMEYGNKGNLR